MSGLQLPPLEPPDPDVDELLDELRRSRGELVEAARIITMLTADDPGPGSFIRTRWRFEHLTAACRCELWAKRIAVLESRCRAYGIDPGGVL